MRETVYLVCVENPDGDIVEWYPTVYRSVASAHAAVDASIPGMVVWHNMMQGSYREDNASFVIYSFGVEG